MRTIAVCMLVIFLGPLAWGQDEGQARVRIAAQKVAFDVSQTLREVDKLPTAEAITRLRSMLAEVHSTPELLENRRKTLAKMLEDRIRVLGVDAPPVQTISDGAGRVLNPADQEKLRRALVRLRPPVEDPKTAAVNQAEQYIKGVQDRVGDTNKTIAAARERERAVQQQVARSSMLPKGDYELPADWKEKTALRSRNLAQPLTAKENAIAKALEETITLRFQNSRFEDVMEYLQTYMKIPIIASKATLDQAGLSYDSPVSIHVKNVATRSALRKLLNDLGLTFIIKDQVLQIVTPEEARTTLTTRTYYVRDLAPTAIHAAYLIDLITTTLDPQSWQRNGGLGSIAYEPISGALVIKQTAEFHFALSSMVR